jgi:hypothetical protein
MEQFTIGDDEDLLDLDGSPTQPAAKPGLGEKHVLNLPPVPSETKPNTHAANAALDPAHPLFISLPTFRMVILADEILESFFDAGFANTFRLADQPATAASPSPLSFTTFASLGVGAASAASAGGPASRPGVVLPPGKGLRGMLDSIVTDGLRVAGEVRRRVEEAQRELDTAAAAGGAKQGSGDDDDDDEEETNEKKGSADAETRSIRSTDRDLLDTAEAEALDHSVVSRPASLMERPREGEPGAASPALGAGVVEFER